MTQLQMIRLLADEGKMLTNGTIIGKVVDVYPVEDVNKWYEIDEPIPEEEDVEPEPIEE